MKYTGGGSFLNLVFEGIYFHMFAIFHKESPVSGSQAELSRPRRKKCMAPDYVWPSKIITLYTASAINNNMEGRRFN